MKPYGKELIIDLHDCDPLLFNRPQIREYFKDLCALIDMEPHDLHFWDDEGVPDELKQTEPHLKGTSAIQFIMTSNITIHCLDLLKSVYVNIFSCKEFDAALAAEFTEEFFGGHIVQRPVYVRF